MKKKKKTYLARVKTNSLNTHVTTIDAEGKQIIITIAPNTWLTILVDEKGMAI